MNGLVGRRLNSRQLEIYLWLTHEGMTVPEILTAQARAIEIVAAHERVAAMHARHQ